MPHVCLVHGRHRKCKSIIEYIIVLICVTLYYYYIIMHYIILSLLGAFRDYLCFLLL